jgi:hypothetical protein
MKDSIPSKAAISKRITDELKEFAASLCVFVHLLHRNSLSESFDP